MSGQFFEIAPRKWISAAAVDAVEFSTGQGPAGECRIARFMTRARMEFSAHGIYAERIEAALRDRGACA